MTGETQDVRDRLLLSILPHVDFDGWSRRALAAGAADAGLTREDLEVAFPDGPTSAIAHFAEWADREMLERMAREADALAEMRFRDRVAFAVMARLEALDRWKEPARRAAAMTAARHPFAAPRQLVVTADRIWRALGDRSADINYYSKRTLLSAVLAASFLYWTNDDDPALEKTRAFVGRRIDEVVRAGGALGRAGRRLASLGEAPFRLAAHLRRRFTGEGEATSSGSGPA
jgi:ubiquinone biosynthesis protein COQ9